MSSSTDSGEAGRQRLLSSALLTPSLALWLASATLAAIGMIVSRQSTLSDVFLLRQDLPVLAATLILLLAMRLMPAPLPGHRVPTGPIARAPWEFAVCAAVVVVGAVGWPLVFARRGLSMDEFWASFDAQIFRHGAVMARVPPEWRSFGAALQPMWRAQVAGGGHWASTYLPVNAALRAVFATLHAEALASPALASLGCWATFAVARRLWPQDRSAAWVALAMVATSSQLLVTAMTPYAMSAHFALDMLWLMAFLNGRAWSYAAAAVLGFFACGLHQLVFHLLFAAPFLVELWLAGRRRAAVLLTASYLATAVFWMSYPAIAFAVVGERAGAGGAGAGSFLARASAMATRIDPLSLSLMGENALRFIAWQNPLLAPLTLAGVGAACRARGVLRPLVIAIVLDLAAVTLVMPYQGHGWGYRYLHGLLGGFALIAAAGWIALTRPDGARPAWRGGPTALAIASVVSVAVLLPWRAYQARALARPYAIAAADIRHDPADVVLVDPTGLWFGVDLVRNDPFLERGPKVMLLQALSLDQIRTLCAAHTLSLFDETRGRRAGLTPLAETRSAKDVERRALVTGSGCRAARLQRTPVRKPPFTNAL